jgi:tetratricopeptide (TPR) repeat protein
LKGNALLDLGEVTEATRWIDEALSLSPLNSQFLAERGHIDQLNKDWPKASDMYSQAEQSAKVYSPGYSRDMDIAKAKWGEGYSLIELGELDRAEAKLRECAEYESHRERAKAEIEYIVSIRKRNNDAND